MPVNEPQIDSRLTQWLVSRNDAQTTELITELKAAMISGELMPPANAATGDAPVKAGGVNFCPNSELKYSTKAAAVPGTTPADTADDNHECYKFYRQQQGANLTLDAAHALKSSAHSLYAANEGADAAIPVWNRVAGELQFGAAAAPLWDAAVRLYNNHVKNNDNVWFVRFSLGALTADIVPDDLEMYCGFWHKTAAGEGWLTGGNFALTHKIEGVKGTRTIKYAVRARTDSGLDITSQILIVTDAPDIADAANFPRIGYGSISNAGYTQFEIYREEAGAVKKIADIRNTNSFTFDDDRTHENDSVPAAALPTASPTGIIALAQSSTLDVGANGAAMIVNDFAISIPFDYNSSETLDKMQFLRFGFTRTCAADRQIRLDRIWCGRSFNVYDESPLDPVAAIPSSAPATGTPSSGDSGGSPPDPGGGGYCILIDTPVLRFNFEGKREWLPFSAIPHGDIIESGDLETRNIVREKKQRGEKEFLIVYFDNGAWLPCTLKHKIFRNGRDVKGKQAQNFRIGDEADGWNSGTRGQTRVTNIVRCRVRQRQKMQFGTFEALRGANNRYVAGFSTDHNSGVFNSNRKGGDLPPHDSEY